MSENQFFQNASGERGIPSTPEQKSEEEFSGEVTIDGLPYIFKGTVSQDKKEASIELLLPQWEKELDELERNNILGIPSDFSETGIIGSVSLSPAFEDGAGADVSLDRIRSFADRLPETSPYYQAHVGRFLMNNILALADSKNWRVVAFAYTDGRLSNDDVYAWLERKGFPPASTPGELIRQPQSTDSTQEIFNFLKS